MKFKIPLIILKTMFPIVLLLEDDTHIYNFTTGNIYIKCTTKRRNGKIIKGYFEKLICNNKKVYKRITIDGKKYLQHRVLFEKYHTIKLQTVNEIDHINLDKGDNTIDNLRMVTHKQNLQNKGKYTNNKSGHKNISWSSSNKKWQVQICYQRYGYFESLEEAILKRNEVIEELNKIPGNIYST